MSIPHELSESAVRRKAKRQGLQLQKCRARNPDNLLYGTYHLIDPYYNTLVFYWYAYGRGFGCTLKECDDFLEQNEKEDQ